MDHDEMAALRSRLTELEAIIERAGLTRDATTSGGTATSGTAAGVPAARSTRRQVLRRSAAAAGAAAAVVVASRVEPVAASDPNDLALGASNVTSATTSLQYTGSSSSNNALTVWASTISTDVASGSGGALGAYTSDARRPYGVYGQVTGIEHGAGVFAFGLPYAGQPDVVGLVASGSTGIKASQSSGYPDEPVIAVQGADGAGITITGTGKQAINAATTASDTILAASTDGVGVRATSVNASGVLGSGPIGVRGQASTASGYGVVAEGTAGAGLIATATTGSAVMGVASGPTGRGVYGQGGATGVEAFGVTGVRARGVTVGVLAEPIDDGIPLAIALRGRGTVGVSGESIGASGTGVIGTGGRGVSGDGATYALVASAAGTAALLLGSTVHGGATSRIAPPLRTDAHVVGEIDIDGDGAVWLCTAAGSPGTWRKIAGPTTAGAFHPVTPGRVYDSRVADPGPAVPIWSGDRRTVSVASRRALDTGVVDLADFVPSGATAITANVTVANTVGSGFLTVNPGGVTTVGAATINWWATGQILNNGVTLTLDGDRRLTIVAGGSSAATTDVIIDVTGYYR